MQGVQFLVGFPSTGGQAWRPPGVQDKGDLWLVGPQAVPRPCQGAEGSRTSKKREKEERGKKGLGEGRKGSQPLKVFCSH